MKISKSNSALNTKQPVKCDAKQQACESIMSAISILSSIAKQDEQAKSAIADLGVVLLDIRD